MNERALGREDREREEEGMLAIRVYQMKPNEDVVLEEQNTQQVGQEPIGASVLTPNIYYEGGNP